jgi:hypothetical protein
MLVYCECCVLSGRGLCDGPIPRPEESYRLWCVIAYDPDSLKKEADQDTPGVVESTEEEEYFWTFNQISFVIDVPHVASDKAQICVYYLY